jgi:hypothetical protein
VKTLVSAACLVLLLAACATQDPTHALAGHALAPPARSACLADIGSRLAPNPEDCAFGRTYTVGDIERTGGRDAAHILQQLDPAVTIIYH